MKKVLALTIVAGGMVLPSQAAVVLAHYTTNIGTATAFHADVTAGTLQLGEGHGTRTADWGTAPTAAATIAGSSTGSAWSMFRSQYTPATPESQTPGSTVALDGITTTITNNSANDLTLGNVSIDLAAASTTNPITSTYQFWVSIDGGAFTAIGSTGTGPSADGSGTDEFNATVVTGDYSSITLTSGQKAEIRLTVADDLTTSSEAVFTQGVKIEGTFVPEPSSAALLGLAGAALILRRRK